MSQPEIGGDSPRRPPAGLRHYIPLFFLAPSLLLLVHGWNGTAPPRPRVMVVVDTGGFQFPGDIHVEVALEGGERATVEGDRASFAWPATRSLRASLVVARASGGSRVTVGDPARFELPETAQTTRFTLVVPARACAAALGKLR